MPRPPLPRFLFILLGALAGLTPLAVDMYLPAIPAIARDLATSIDGAQLTISAFLGGFAIGQLFTARSPTAMYKPVILAGLVMLPSPRWAVPWRTPCPSCWRTGCCRQLAGRPARWWSMRCCATCSKEAFSRAMSFVILVMTLAPLVAPVVGGYISAHSDWRVIFWLLVGSACSSA